MDNLKRKLIIAYCLFVAAAFVYVPHKIFFGSEKTPRFSNWYDFVFSPPDKIWNTKVAAAAINFELLLMEIIIITALFVAFFWYRKGKVQ